MDCERCKKEIQGLAIYLKITRTRRVDLYRLCTPCVQHIERILVDRT